MNYQLLKMLSTFSDFGGITLNSLQISKTNNPILKPELHRHFRKDTKMANNNMKRHSKSLVTRGIQTKVTGNIK